MPRNNDHYVVLGAWPKADKGALAYYDRDAGMYAVKILQLREDMVSETGGFDLDNVEGEYVTIFFAHQRGRDSLRMLIEALTALGERWDEEAAEAAENK